MGYTAYTPYIVFFFYEREEILIDHPNLVETKPAPSPRIVKTVNLTIIRLQSWVRHIYGTSMGRGGTCGGGFWLLTILRPITLNSGLLLSIKSEF